MNRKTYLIIITVVTIICIIGGTLYHVGGLFSERLWVGRYNNKTTFSSDKEALPDVSNIDLDIDAMEVRIEEGDILSYSYKGPERLAPIVNNSGDTLSFESHGKGKMNIVRMGDFEGGTLIIYVPQGISFNNVNINLDFGDIQIKELICNNLDIEADAGNIEIYESKFNKSDIEAALGNIEIYDTLLGDSNISCNMGNVECNSIDIKSLDISNDLGNTEVYLTGKDSDYNFELSVDLGSLELNGKEYKGNYNSYDVGGKPVTIENDMGNITVKCR